MLVISGERSQSFMFPALKNSAARIFESNPNKIIIFITAKYTCQSETECLACSKDIRPRL